MSGEKKFGLQTNQFLLVHAKALCENKACLSYKEKIYKRSVILESKPRVHITLTPFPELMTLIYGVFPALSLSNVLL